MGSKCKDTGPPFKPDFIATTTASLLGNIRTNSRGEALVRPESNQETERVCLICVFLRCMFIALVQTLDSLKNALLILIISRR